MRWSLLLHAERHSARKQRVAGRGLSSCGSVVGAWERVRWPAWRQPSQLKNKLASDRPLFIYCGILALHFEPRERLGTVSDPKPKREFEEAGPWL